MRKFKVVLAATVITLAGATAYADGHAKGWTLDPTLSQVSFGSIKNNSTGESHSFGKVSGMVGADGSVTIQLGLLSVETNIEIRNERMAEFVFDNQPTATITAALDMAELDTLAVGAATVIQTEGTLSLLGTDTDLDANFFVMRLSEDKVLVSTNDLIMLSTEDAGIDVKVDKLQELASLDSITRVSPVAMRLVFDAAQ